ncbi:MAG: VOC family protein [Acidobacteria bacterium]|nr:VOC family protein [Acidobacteriota bacterium]MBI3488791.1 VOC family protein [Acidobacteriota bacterium]
MLDRAPIVGFLFTTDYARARAFYEGILGFRVESQDAFALVIRAGGTRVRISRVPDFQPVQGTVLGWEVPDVPNAARWLRERGVETEKYPFVEDSDLGVWRAPGGAEVAWFKDPDGNVLSLSNTGAGQA